MLPAGQLDELGAGRKTSPMATWRVDPAENRDLQIESGVDPNKFQGSIENNNQTGGSKRTRFQSYRYPNKMLTNSTDYLKIKIIKYIPNSAFSGTSGGASKPAGNTNGNKNKYSFTSYARKGFNMETISSRTKNASPLAQILLPIPENIGDTTTTGWKEDELNPLQALGSQLALTAMTDPGKILEGAKNLDGFGQIDDTTKQAILSKLAGMAVGKKGMVTRATGQVMNPNLEVLFDGVNVRSQSFDFNFSPRNLSEANQVKRIIRLFKQHMAAKRASGNGFFIGSPDIFILEYMKGQARHPFLNVFKPMALTSCRMNYTGNGTYSTFHDGTPTLMNMTLSFQELNPIYFEDYDEGEGRIGVGY